MRFLSYNIHGCIGLDGAPSPESILAVIEEAGADVVALQEVHDDERVDRSFLRRLEDLDYREIIYGPTMRKTQGPYGNILMSRYPASHWERIDISRPGYEPRGAIRLQIEPQGVLIEITTTHLGLNSSERRDQIRMLARHPSPPGRCRSRIRITMGDFNEWWPWSRGMFLLRRAFGVSRAVPTFPSRFPLLALDRIWILPASTRLRVWSPLTAHARAGSDHRPLLAELEI